MTDTQKVNKLEIPLILTKAGKKTPQQGGGEEKMTD